MPVANVFILLRDGRVVFSGSFGGGAVDSIVEPQLLGGMLSALDGVSRIAGGGHIREFKAEDRSFFVLDFSSFLVVVSSQVPPPQRLLEDIGMRFTSEYGADLIDWDGNLDKFNPFKEMLEDILVGYVDKGVMVSPLRPLDSLAILSLSQATQVVAKAVLALVEGDAEQVREETGLEAPTVEKELENLVGMGFLGKKTSLVGGKNTVRYFLRPT